MDVLHWNNKDKTLKKNPRSSFPGKVQGTSFVDQNMVINSLPIHDTHCVWCTRKCVGQRNKNITKPKTLVIPVLFAFFPFFLPEQLLGKLNDCREMWYAVLPPTQRSSFPHPAHQFLTDRSVHRSREEGKKKTLVDLNVDCIYNPNCAFPFWSNSVDVQELWKPEQLSFTHLAGLFAGFGKRYLSTSPLQDI